MADANVGTGKAVAVGTGAAVADGTGAAVAVGLDGSAVGAGEPVTAGVEVGLVDSIYPA